MFGSPGLQRWLYRISLFIFLILFIGFSAVMPIDAIAKASHSANSPLNTFIVIGAIVLFLIVAITLTVGRLFMLKTLLKDIPKQYIPIGKDDIPIKCHNKIQKEYHRSVEIGNEAKNPIVKVYHDGMSPPENNMLPGQIVYQNIVGLIHDRLKYQGDFFSLGHPIVKSHTVREIFWDLHNQGLLRDVEKNNEFIALYEKLRYSGREVTYEEFISFMEACIGILESGRSIEKE